MAGRYKKGEVLIAPLTASFLDEVYKNQQQVYEAGYWESLESFQKMVDLYPPGSFMALVEGQLAGYHLVHPCKGDQIQLPDHVPDKLPLDPDAMYFHDICIYPAFRGRGLATLLLEKSEALSVKEGFNTQVGVAVQGSLPMWLKKGWKVLKEIEHFGGAKAHHIKKHF